MSDALKHFGVSAQLLTHADGNQLANDLTGVSKLELVEAQVKLLVCIDWVNGTFDRIKFFSFPDNEQVSGAIERYLNLITRELEKIAAEKN